MAYKLLKVVTAAATTYPIPLIVELAGIICYCGKKLKSIIISSLKKTHFFDIQKISEVKS